ncbi:HAMP domain-containing sensor histidine kinase [Marinicrinis lubricantis]|uniref:histidine kinase n=1 Tax=Marinicrinis lubricantis TaxID=2086470 RepID=A0ABW1ILT1_9BACL
MVILKKLRQVKWQLLVYFLIAGAASAGGMAAVMYYHEHPVEDRVFWFWIVPLILMIQFIIGYAAARRIQSDVDLLQLKLAQIENGNYHTRVPGTGFGPMDLLYKTFNSMAASLEHRTKRLQSMGEESTVKEQSKERAVLEERRRLARDLHDTVSQHLFAIHMSSSSLPRILEKNPEAAGQVIEQLIEMSHLAQKQMRGLIAQLRPMELEGKSLAEAVEKWFPDYCRQNGLQGSLEMRLDHKVSEPIEHQLFLILQEAMANIVKHASAVHAVLSIVLEDRQLKMSLSDDGKGFSGQSKAGSYGLGTMRERAEKIGGSLEIISLQGSGTRVLVRIPMFEETELLQSGVGDGNE